MNCPMCESDNILQISANGYKCEDCKQWFSIETRKQSEINWELVEEQMQRNTKDRFDWKSYLGMSLTRAIARLKAEGLNQDDTYNELCKTHPNLSDELKRRLKIGIAARFGEMATAMSELRK